MLTVTTRKLYKRICAALVLLCMLLTFVDLSECSVYAANNKTLTLSAAKDLAIKNSSKIEALEDKVVSKESAYKSAVKSAKLKDKNLRTFRWSPLLSFKFPTQPNFSQAVEINYKPVQAAGAVTVAKHALADQYFEEYKKVYQLFVSIVSTQEKIDFNQKRLDLMEETLKKNKARWLLGEASEADIQKMEKSVDSLNKSIAADSRTMLNDQKKLGKILDLDITTGYDFENPFVKATIPRSALDGLIERTLDNDQTYFNACSDATLAYQALKTDKQLIQGQYKSSDYNIIASYVNQALNGEKVNKKGFKTAYEKFLQEIDKYWQGKKKILFIKIPREWFRGDLDGVRYVEDDPYALFDAALDYGDKINEKNSVEEELRTQVLDTYNNVESMRNAYESNVALVENELKNMDKASVMNRVGLLSYDEFASMQSSVEQLQLDMQTSLADYSDILYEFDRLTCGGVTDYLSGTGSSMFAVGGGVSTITEENANGAYYYINPIAQQNIFEIFIKLPEDMDVSISHFALIVNGIQIGDKTPVNGKIRHLGLDLTDVVSAKIRLYDGDNVVCDCDIDPENYSGPLDIITGYSVNSVDDNNLGLYKIENLSGSGLTNIEFELNSGSEIKYFKLRTDEGKYIGGEDFNSVDAPFRYVGVLGSDMDKVTIEFFDKDKNYLYDAIFSNGSKVTRLKNAD